VESRNTMELKLMLNHSGAKYYFLSVFRALMALLHCYDRKILGNSEREKTAVWMRQVTRIVWKRN
jgi:hypothetical protein